MIPMDDRDEVKIKESQRELQMFRQQHPCGRWKVTRYQALVINSDCSRLKNQLAKTLNGTQQPKESANSWRKKSAQKALNHHWKFRRYCARHGWPLSEPIRRFLVN